MNCVNRIFAEKGELLRLWALKLHPGSGQHPWIFVSLSYSAQFCEEVCAWTPFGAGLQHSSIFQNYGGNGSVTPQKVKNN